MGRKHRSREEQMELIMQCRASGLSDYHWCEQHGIPNSTFYNWITRLRKANYQFPDATPTTSKPVTQEIVKVGVISEEMEQNSIIEKHNTPTSSCIENDLHTTNSPAVAIQMSDKLIRFSIQRRKRLINRR